MASIHEIKKIGKKSRDTAPLTVTWHINCQGFLNFLRHKTTILMTSC